MHLDLNPERFSEPLTFLWLRSDEGTNWLEGLEKELKELQISSIAKTRVISLVKNRLDNVGKFRFRRHYEIKQIVSARDHNLLEIRWRQDLPSGPLNLRLYCTVVYDLSLLLGVCFRVKRLGISEQETRDYQNQDIASAVKIFQRNFQKDLYALMREES